MFINHFSRKGIAAALIMIVCCVLAGIDAFNRMDILEIKKNEAN